MKKILCLLIISFGLISCANRESTKKVNDVNIDLKRSFYDMQMFAIDISQATTIPYVRGNTTYSFNLGDKVGVISYSSNPIDGHEYEATIEISGDFGNYIVQTKYDQYYTLVSHGIVYQTYNETTDLIDLIYLDFNGWVEKTMSSFDVGSGITNYFGNVKQYDDYIVFSEPSGTIEDGLPFHQVSAFNLNSNIKQIILAKGLFVNVYNKSLYAVDLSDKDKQVLVQYSKDLETIEERIEALNFSAAVTSSSEMLFYAEMNKEGKELMHFVTPEKEVEIEYTVSTNPMTSELGTSTSGGINWVDIEKDIALITIHEGMGYNYYLYKFGYDFLIKFDGQYPFATIVNDEIRYSPEFSGDRYVFTYDDLNAQFKKIKDSIK